MNLWEGSCEDGKWMGLAGFGITAMVTAFEEFEVKFNISRYGTRTVSPSCHLQQLAGLLILCCLISCVF